MSGEFEKYAIYWVPKRSDPLARFGIGWTGWCAEQGELRPITSFGKLSFDPALVTRKLRRHGLHGVIRAPFGLQAGRSWFALEHALRDLIEGSMACAMPRLKVAVIDGRVAIAPVDGGSALSNLIGRIDAAIGPIVQAQSAVATAADVAGAGNVGVIQLPSTQAHRFNIPLTDRLEVNDAFRIAAEMEPLLAPMLDQPRRLSDIALMADPGGGRRLRVLHRLDLRQTPPRPASSVLPVMGPDMLVPTSRADIAV